MRNKIKKMLARKIERKNNGIRKSMTEIRKYERDKI